MLLIGPLPDAGYLGIVNLYLVVNLFGTERGAAAGEERNDYDGGHRGTLYQADNLHAEAF